MSFPPGLTQATVPLMSWNSPGPLRVVGAATLVEGGLIAAAFIGGWRLDVRPLAATAPSWNAFVAGVAATLPLLLGLAWSLRTRFGPVARLARDVEDRIIPVFEGCSVGHLAAIAVLAGIGEEIFFRGLIQTAVAGWVGPWGGLLLASAAFGIAHPVTPLYGALAALIGLYLGALFLVTENLVVPAIVHTVYDFVALAYLRSRPPAGAVMD